MRFHGLGRVVGTPLGVEYMRNAMLDLLERTLPIRRCNRPCSAERDMWPTQGTDPVLLVPVVKQYFILSEIPT